MIMMEFWVFFNSEKGSQEFRFAIFAILLKKTRNRL